MVDTAGSGNTAIRRQSLRTAATEREERAVDDQNINPAISTINAPTPWDRTVETRTSFETFLDTPTPFEAGFAPGATGLRTSDAETTPPIETRSDPVAEAQSNLDKQIAGGGSIRAIENAAENLRLAEQEAAGDNDQFVNAENIQELESVKSDLEQARTTNRPRLDAANNAVAEQEEQIEAIEESIEDVEDQIHEIEDSEQATTDSGIRALRDLDEQKNDLDDQLNEAERELRPLENEQNFRRAIDNELGVAIGDIDELLSLNTEIQNRETQIENLEQRIQSLEEELNASPTPRDTTHSPPSSYDAMAENHITALTNDLQDARNDLDAARRELGELRDPRIDDLVDIAVVQGETLVREDELRHAGLYPENTDRFMASDAIGTVYLNTENRATIERLAEEYDIPPELLAGVVAAEIDFDHDDLDYIQDGLGRRGLHPGNQISGGGVGVASVRDDTLERAIEHLAAERHGFQFDPRVLDKDYRATFTGSVESAAVVISYLTEQYGGTENLSAEDMAQIWGGFRTGVADINDIDGRYGYANVEDWRNGQARGTENLDNRFQVGSNAYMSQPIFEFFEERYP